MSESLEFTGERFTPECTREIWYEHLHRYAFARNLVQGLDVLDAACGEGYGSDLLASTANRVDGVDISDQAIQHAESRYSRDNLSFRVSDCLELPFDDDSFDAVVSFETLEHMKQHDELLAEFRRVLKPGGFLLISSPDKAVYTDRMGNENPHHLRELYRDEFEALINRHFPACQLFGQKLLFESAIWSLQGREGVTLQQEKQGVVDQVKAPGHDPVYFLALCASEESRLPEPGVGLHLFDDAADSVYEHYYHEIRKNMSAGGVLQERERQITELQDALRRERSMPWWRKLLGKS